MLQEYKVKKQPFQTIQASYIVITFLTQNLIQISYSNEDEVLME